MAEHLHLHMAFLGHHPGGARLQKLSFRSHLHLASNNHNSKNLWQNICISTWPSLLATPAVPDFYFSGLKNFHSNVISTLPGGYRTFFSDAFPSIHSHDLNTINPPPPSPPLFIRFYYAVDVFLHGQPHPFSSLCATQLVQTRQVFDDFMGFKFRLYPLKHKLKNFIKVKKQGFEEYLKQNLTLSCVVIETKVSKHAGSLFTPGCKPVEVKPAATSGRVKVIFETLLPSLSNLYTQMIKCRTKIVCGWQGDAEDKFCVKCVYSTFKDMNGKRLLERHAAIIILNAIINGERKNK
ncbi:F-box protein, partial [Trifolium medium]|nr:F-box protein [Trifolium medium]